MTQHVVIVDDDDLTLKLFSGIAGEIPNVEVHTFSTSTEAIDWYRGKTVDCFVFDYNMPVPNGLQMIALVRALPEFALVPIVIVTGAHEREIRYKALDAGATDFLQKPVDYREMLARLQTLLALQAAQKRLALQIGDLEASLIDSEERARHHAERLEALWGIANNPNLNDDELTFAMLQRGAAAIRPGQPFRGVLGRIDGDLVHIETFADALGYEAPDGVGIESGGGAVPLDQTIFGRTSEFEDGTRAYDDLRQSDRVTELADEQGWRAMIGTVFSAGGSRYALAFFSQFPTVKPFGPEDNAYVEVISSFFSSHYRQRWQSARIGHQLEHDSLTGLWNRMRFRSLARAAFRPGDSAAIAVMDLVNFHVLNEEYSHLTGDAVLVEVAAAVADKAQEGEIVARIGSDAFAIYFPAVPSRQWLVESIARFGTAFDLPMGLGDREGKESLHVSGRAGFACAPADGATVDELLLRAEGRARRGAPPEDQRIFP